MRKLFTICVALLFSGSLFAQFHETSNHGNCFSHYIGEQYGGGVIFHLYKDTTGVEHGLIVALADLPKETWSRPFCIDIGDSARSSWDGVKNSRSIAQNNRLKSSAAKTCIDMQNGGYSDWYLPSIQELSMLWNNYYTVARSLSQIPEASKLADDFFAYTYWSSTEHAGCLAWRISFNSGNPEYCDKLTPCNIRAIRAF